MAIIGVTVKSDAESLTNEPAEQLVSEVGNTEVVAWADDHAAPELVVVPFKRGAWAFSDPEVFLSDRAWLDYAAESAPVARKAE